MRMGLKVEDGQKCLYVYIAVAVGQAGVLLLGGKKSSVNWSKVQKWWSFGPFTPNYIFIRFGAH